MFTFITTIILIFLAHPISIDFWNLPPLSWIDFPWRLLTPLAFFIALMTIFLSIHKVTKFIGIILIVLTVVLSVKFAVPKEYFQKSDNYYITNDATTTSKDELLPIWVVDKPTQRYKDKVEIEKGTAVVANLKYNSKMISFRLYSEGESIVKINTIYFPGWQFTADREEIIPTYFNTQGVMKFSFNTGEYYVKGSFRETLVRTISNWISLLCAIVVCSVIFYHFLKLLINKEKV